MGRVRGLARRTDDLIFDLVFQPLVDRVWRVPPAALARLALGGYVVLVMVQALVVHHEGRLGAQQVVGLGTALALATTLHGAWPSSAPAPFGRNPRRVLTSFLMIRMLGLAVMLMPLAMLPWVPQLGFKYWVTLAGNVLVIASLYLDGCDLPPPPVRESARADGPMRAGLG